MSETLREIESQPASWRTAAALATQHRGALPSPGARIAAVGCGTSWFIAQAFAARRESLGHGETDAFTATELPPSRRYDRILAISRSGTTTEIVRLLEAATGPRTVLTAVADSPVTATAEHAVVLDFADESSVVQTRFATSALAFLRAHLGEDLSGPIDDAERALAMPLPHDPTAFDHFVFLGAGWTNGLANEAALKLRETCQAHTESYPAMEYRHGPVSLAGPRSLVWILGSPDPTVAADVAATGATVRTATLEPMAELVLIHRTAVALAGARGLDPDHPRHLTRSVVLP